MIQDYAGRSGLVFSKKKQGAWQKTPKTPESGGEVWKMTVLFLGIALLLGLGASVWFRSIIGAVQKELSQAEMTRKEFGDTNERLLAQRNKLMSKDHFEAAAAAKLGLYPPVPEQIRKP